MFPCRTIAEGDFCFCGLKPPRSGDGVWGLVPRRVWAAAQRNPVPPSRSDSKHKNQGAKRHLIPTKLLQTICFIFLLCSLGLRPAGVGVTRLRCRRGNALRWGLGIRGIGATRPLCGIQRGGNRKSQGALARLCEFPGISPPKSPKNPITLIKTSRDTLHPGTGVTTRTNRPAGRVRGLGLRG